MRSLQSHLDDPNLGSGFGAVDATGATDGCAGGSCGVIAHFRLDVDPRGVIRDCSARVRGRASAFATASALCESARGLTVLEASRLGIGTLHESFAQLDEEDLERALVAEDGFHHALGRWLLEQMHALPAGTGSRRPAIDAVFEPDARVEAVVGMSGGVDSAVALHRMLDEFDGSVVGVTLRLWIDPRAPDPEAACCSPDSVRRARRTCHSAGVGHLSIDLRESFAANVVVPFVSSYAGGETPNPCVRCNGRFRLDELVRLADVAGAARVVTGHYARIVERGGASLIARGVDPVKDQSYMLAEVEGATVERLRFPLGEEHKPQVREEAAARGLEQATTSDSQEVCFLGGGDYREFLARARASGRSGELVLDRGDGAELEVVGSHDGIARFTPGQRKGIGVAHESPLYVLDVEPASGRVLVGPARAAASHLDRTSITIDDVRWHDPALPDRALVQLRYRMREGAVGARVERGGEDGGVVLHFDEPRRAPAPGQVAVLYDETGVVLGAGRIRREPVNSR